MKTTIHGNWEEVLSALKSLQDLNQSEFLEQMMTANAQAAYTNLFGSPANHEMAEALISPTAARGGTIVRSFWWGFHIEISHTDLEKILHSSDPIKMVKDAIGKNVPGPAIPFIAVAATFIVSSLKPLQLLDQGRGVYISMSWFAPGVFVPTSV